jgi:hypothetical protein
MSYNNVKLKNFKKKKIEKNKSLNKLNKKQGSYLVKHQNKV